jgi:hypothetical protein
LCEDKEREDHSGRRERQLADADGGEGVERGFGEGGSEAILHGADDEVKGGEDESGAFGEAGGGEGAFRIGDVGPEPEAVPRLRRRRAVEA